VCLDAARGGARVCVSVPPRHGKTELLSRYLPAWYIGTYPHRRVLLASYEADFAATHGARARDLLVEHGGLFGVRLRNDSSARHRWETTLGGGMTTAGVGGPLTGRGADLLIVDDAVKSAEEANSELMRNRAWDWFRSVALTRLEPRGSVIVVGTRWHEDDLLGRITREEPERWRLISLPAVAEENDPLGRQAGDALWPERYPLQALEAIKQSVGSYWWSAMYQGRPAPAGGGIFRRDWFRRYRSLGDAYELDGRVTPASVCRVFVTTDLALSQRSDADYTVVMTAALTPTGDLLILDVVRRRVAGPDIVPLLRSTYERWAPVWIGVERVAFQTVIIEEARRAGLPIHELRPDADKVTRALPAAARMEGGQVAWRDGAAWAGELEDELLGFPAGRHDDMVDALAYAVTEVARGSVGSFGPVTSRPRGRLPDIHERITALRPRTFAETRRSEWVSRGWRPQ
jgi:predicted phage terminase large subunit-like protein